MGEVVKNILIFGDSIVRGGFDIWGGGWPKRLRTYFKKNKAKTGVFRYGINGDDTERVLARLEKQINGRRPEAIIFAVGLNDSQVVNNKPRIPVESFRINMSALAGKGRKSAQKVVFVGLSRVDERKTHPVFWNSKASYENDLINKYDTVVKLIAEKEGCFYVAVSDLFEDRTLLFDGVHPNSKGHKKMFERIAGFLFAKVL